MLIEVFKYKQWADRRTLDAIQAIDAAHAGAMAFVLQQLNHMIIVEELFKARLLGVPAPHAATNTESLPDWQALDQRISASNAWFSHYVERLPAAQREETVSFLFADGKPGRMTRLEILFHIVNHGTYHRGAIGHALDLAGAPRPADTYTVFIHAAEPARRMPSC